MKKWLFSYSLRKNLALWSGPLYLNCSASALSEGHESGWQSFGTSAWKMSNRYFLISFAETPVPCSFFTRLSSKKRSFLDLKSSSPIYASVLLPAFPILTFNVGTERVSEVCELRLHGCLHIGRSFENLCIRIQEIHKRKVQWWGLEK